MSGLKSPLWAAVTALAGITACVSAQTVTLTLDGIRPWTTFEGHAGQKDFEDDLAGLLDFTVTSQSGTGLVPLQKLSLYSVELQQGIGLKSTGNVYSVVGAAQASSGVHAGLSANIPLAGIGATRAASLEVLYSHVFNSHYDPGSLSDKSKSAFQLAVWELSHDDNFDLKNETAGGFYVETDGAAVNEAQALVRWVQANVATAPKMPLSALHSSTTQDFLIPTQSYLSIIPEPSTYQLLAGLAVLSSLVWRRRIPAIR